MPLGECKGWPMDRDTPPHDEPPLERDNPWWGRYWADPWAGRFETVVMGLADEPQGLVLAAVRGVLSVALASREVASPEEAALDDAHAVPIHGAGGEISELIADLAEEVLDRLAIHGSGLDHLRLDGMLETDTGGYSAWGYVVGRADGPAIPVVQLVGVPVVEMRSPDDAGEGPLLSVRIRVTREGAHGSR